MVRFNLMGNTFKTSSNKFYLYYFGFLQLYYFKYMKEKSKNLTNGVK